MVLEGRYVRLIDVHGDVAVANLECRSGDWAVCFRARRWRARTWTVGLEGWNEADRSGLGRLESSLGIVLMCANIWSLGFSTLHRRSEGLCAHAPTPTHSISPSKHPSHSSPTQQTSHQDHPC